MAACVIRNMTVIARARNARPYRRITNANHIYSVRHERKGTPLNVDLIFKIAAIGILVAVLNQVLSRSGREEQATMVTLTGLVVVLMMVVQQISELFNLVKELFGL